MSKPEKLHDHPACGPIRSLLTTIGSKWAVLTISLLSQSPMRFSDLKRRVGDISQKSLTSVLRELEKDGIVERTVTPIIPPRVDYRLTALGRSLIEPINALASWAIENERAVTEAREGFAQAAA